MRAFIGAKTADEPSSAVLAAEAFRSTSIEGKILMFQATLIASAVVKAPAAGWREPVSRAHSMGRNVSRGSGLMRRGALLLAAVLALGSPATAAPAVYRVTIADMTFGPTPAKARAGDTIEWINADILQHSATAKDGSFDVTLAPKAHVRTVLKRAGTVAFYCRYHPAMVGSLVVAP
jgi:plastocyanin